MENRGTIARTDVVPLSVDRAGVVDLEKELQEPPVAYLVRIEDDLDGFGMVPVVALGGMGDVAARVAHAGGHDTVVSADEILHPPAAAACQNCAIFRHQIFSS
jgi:hypothetical protein